MSVNRTIEEVEKKIRADPSLPKLSRTDIVDILQNITTKDLISDYKTLEKTRNDYQRALMVVLPYNSNGAEEHLKDLYTRPPIVQMLSDEDIFNEQEKNRFSNEDSLKKQVSDNFIPTFPTAGSIDEPSRGVQHKDEKEKVDSKLDSTPERFSFDLEKLSEGLTTTKRPTYTWRPVPKISNPSEDETSSIIDLISAFESSTTEAPFSKSTQHVLSSDQWRYHPPPSTTSKPQYRTTSTTPKPSYPPQREYFLPTVQSSPDKYNHQVELNINQEENTKQDSNTFKFLESEAMTLPTTKTEQSSAVFVTPMQHMKTQDSFKSSAEESDQSTMRPEVEDLLKSIGLRPLNNPDLKFEKIPTKFQIPDSNNVIYNSNVGLTTAGVDTVSIADQNTFDNFDQIKKGVDNLTPAVQLLFKKFGLPTNLDFQSLTTTTTTTVKPTQASYYSYTNFKPLPNSSVRDKDMRDFLARFGLGESRNQKSMRTRKNTGDEPPSLIEAVPMNMKKILENIGLIRPRARIDDTRKEVSRQSITSSKLHVFKPQESSVFNDQQRAKINELLDTVKKVQKGKATIDAVQKVADEVLQSTKSLPEGPDPVSLEEILKLYKEDLKNEVKRQQAAETYVKETKEKSNEEMVVKKEKVVKKEVANEEIVVGVKKNVNEEKNVQNENVRVENVKVENSREENGNKKENKQKEVNVGLSDKEKKEEKGTGSEDQKFSFSAAASSGIKKFMVNVLGSSEMWFGKIIGGFSKVKSFFTNVAGKLKHAISY